MTEYPLTESERGLIEGGAANWADIMEGRRLLRMAIDREFAEAAAVRQWDDSHCGICGAVLTEEPNHCRKEQA